MNTESCLLLGVRRRQGQGQGESVHGLTGTYTSNIMIKYSEINVSNETDLASIVHNK